MLKSSKGITLVALVITIIVLLILAGVTLSIVMQTGIMDNSQSAVNAWDNSVANESDFWDYWTPIIGNYIQNNLPTSN